MSLFSRRLLQSILGTLGATAAGAACGSTTSPDSTYGDAGVTADAGIASDTAPAADTSVGYDVTSIPTDASAACPVKATSTFLDLKDVCGGSVDAGASYAARRICFPLPTDAGTCASTYDRACVLSQYSCGLNQSGDTVACGPLDTTPEACCYDVLGGCPVGRPFTVDGVARVASVTGDSGWATAIAPSIAELDATTRAALAAAWTEEGITEHASVASFSRMALELLSLGAPAVLVEDTLTAALDEKRHATGAFGLAKAYGGVTVGPGKLDTSRSLDASGVVAIAERLAAEGCVAETVSAALVAEACAQATCPVVKAHLAIVAEEEARHAVLAWQTLGWILGHADVTGDARERVARIFARAEQHVGFGVTPVTGDREALRGHGHLPLAEKHIVARGVLAGVVREAARALLKRGAGLDAADAVDAVDAVDAADVANATNATKPTKTNGANA